MDDETNLFKVAGARERIIRKDSGGASHYVRVYRQSRQAIEYLAGKRSIFSSIFEDGEHLINVFKKQAALGKTKAVIESTNFFFGLHLTTVFTYE